MIRKNLKKKYKIERDSERDREVARFPVPISTLKSASELQLYVNGGAGVFYRGAEEECGAS